MKLTHVVALAALQQVGQVAACDKSKLNSTTSTYTPVEGETIFDIAAAVDRGACDIVRYNRMADALLISPGDTYSIPGQVCNPDNHSCFVPEKYTHSKKICIPAGPHTYTTQLNDTTRYIAQKLDISVQALNSSAGFMLGEGEFDFDYILTAGTTVKLPICANSTCTLYPYEMVGKTCYQDIADAYATTVGRMQALNSQYNFSAWSTDGGPVISFAGNCDIPCDTKGCAIVGN